MNYMPLREKWATTEQRRPVSGEGFAFARWVQWHIQTGRWRGYSRHGWRCVGCRWLWRDLQYKFRVGLK